MASTTPDGGDQRQETSAAEVTMTRDPDRSEYFAGNRMREVHFGAKHDCVLCL